MLTTEKHFKWLTAFQKKNHVIQFVCVGVSNACMIARVTMDMLKSPACNIFSKIIRMFGANKFGGIRISIGIDFGGVCIIVFFSDDDK